MISKKSEGKNNREEIVLVDSKGGANVYSNNTEIDSKTGESATITGINERYNQFYKQYKERKFNETKTNEERTDSTADTTVNKPFIETYGKGYERK